MGSDFTKDTGLADMSKLSGIEGLPSSAKVPFIKALRAEAAGNHADAATLLDKAVEAEQAFLSANAPK